MHLQIGGVFSRIWGVVYNHVCRCNTPIPAVFSWNFWQTLIFLTNARLQAHPYNDPVWPYTVKLAHAKLPANASKFTCLLHVKNSTRSLHAWPAVNLLKQVILLASTRQARRAENTRNACRPHINIHEQNNYFTGNYTGGIHASFYATGLQNCLFLQAKNQQSAAKHPQSQGEPPASAGKNIAIADRLDCILQVMLPSSCVIHYMLSRGISVRG